MTDLIQNTQTHEPTLTEHMEGFLFNLYVSVVSALNLSPEIYHSIISSVPVQTSCVLLICILNLCQEAQQQSTAA